MMILRHGTALLLCLGACTPLRPRVSLERGASLTDYRVFIVGPVTNQTGARFNLNVTDFLRQELTLRLRSHGLTVVTEAAAETDDPALVITSALVGFKGMSFALQIPGPGVTKCELHSELNDLETGRRIGQIVASALEERTRPLTVLNMCAHDLADAIEREVRRGRRR